MTVATLKTPAGFAPSPELQAQYIEGIAAQIRRGDLEIDRAVFVFALKNGGIATDVFGGAANVMECVGLMHMASMELALNPAGES